MKYFKRIDYEVSRDSAGFSAANDRKRAKYDQRPAITYGTGHLVQYLLQTVKKLTGKTVILRPLLKEIIPRQGK